MFENKNIVLYVTGSVAAYKSLTLARLLLKKGARVQVVMSQGSTKFITPLLFQTLTKRPVFTDVFEELDSHDITHIKIARWADLSIVVPASANIIAKIANGIADDAVTTTLLATDSPKIIVPAMNNNMWKNVAMQRNIHRLQLDGITLLDTKVGLLAEGYVAQGRMLEPDEIITAIEHQFDYPTYDNLVGKTILVTAGGTKEFIDPVRYIGNNSSGKMGIAIANAAANAGAHVILVTTQNNLSINNQIDKIVVETSSEMLNAIKNVYESVDVLIMAAAVSDYRPTTYTPQKIKKHDENLNLQLVRTPDILLELSKLKQRQFMVGFAAETEQVLANAQNKLAKKKLDLLLANDVSNKNIGFNSDNNQVSFIDQNGVFAKTQVESKQRIAIELLKILNRRI